MHYAIKEGKVHKIMKLAEMGISLDGFKFRWRHGLAACGFDLVVSDAGAASRDRLRGA